MPLPPIWILIPLITTEPSIGSPCDEPVARSGWILTEPSRDEIDTLNRQMAEGGFAPLKRDPRCFQPAPGALPHFSRLPSSLPAFGLQLSANNTPADLLNSMPSTESILSLWMKDFEDGTACVNAAARQQNLRSLSLEECNVTDADLTQLSKLEHLEELNLIGTKTVGEGLAALRSLKRLRSLEIDLSPKKLNVLLSCGMVHLLPIAHGTNRMAVQSDGDVIELELNGFYGYDVTNEMLNGVERLKSLRKLSLIESKIDDHAWPALARIANLEILNLERTRITDLTLQSLSVVPSSTLHSLVLDETAVTPAGLDFLGKLSNLTTLHLNRCSLDDSALEPLGRLKSLTHLEIGSTAVRFDVAIPDPSFPKLQHLNVNGSPIKSDGLRRIAKLPSLRWLDLTRCKTCGNGIEALKECQTLEVLYLNLSDVSDSAIPHLMKLKSLKTLSLNSTSVTDSGVRHLKSMTSLKKLILSGTKVILATVTDLQTSLPDCEIIY